MKDCYLPIIYFFRQEFTDLNIICDFVFSIRWTVEWKDPYWVKI